MAIEESHEHPEGAELRKPPLNAPQDGSRPAAAGRHDIVEDADAGGLWSEVDGLLTIDFSRELANLHQSGNYLAGAGPNGLDPSQIPLPPEMTAAARQAADGAVEEPGHEPPVDEGTVGTATDSRAPESSGLVDAPTPSDPAETVVAETPTVLADTPPPSVLSDPPPTAPPRPAPPILEDIDPVETIPASAFTFGAPSVGQEDDTVLLDAVVVEEPDGTAVPPQPTAPPSTSAFDAPRSDTAPGGPIPGPASGAPGPIPGVPGAPDVGAFPGFDAARLDGRPSPAPDVASSPLRDGSIDPLLAPVPVSGAQNFDFFREATGNQAPAAGRGLSAAGGGFGAAPPAPRARAVETGPAGIPGTDKVRDIIDRRLFAGVLALLGLGVVGFAGWFVTTQFEGDGNRSEAVLDDPLETTAPEEPAAGADDDLGVTVLPPTTFAITTSTVTNTAPPPTQPRATAAPTTGGGTTASSAATTATTAGTTAPTTATTRPATTATTAPTTVTTAPTTTTTVAPTTTSTTAASSSTTAAGDGGADDD